MQAEMGTSYESLATKRPIAGGSLFSSNTQTRFCTRTRGRAFVEQRDVCVYQVA